MDKPDSFKDLIDQLLWNGIGLDGKSKTVVVGWGAYRFISYAGRKVLQKRRNITIVDASHPIEEIDQRMRGHWLSAAYFWDMPEHDPIVNVVRRRILQQPKEVHFFYE